MPSVVGTFKVVTNSGQLEIGDTFAIAPKTLSKTYGGSGTNPTGDFGTSINFFSFTNILDPDVNDQLSVWPKGPYFW
jgi:spore germination protein PF